MGCREEDVWLRLEDLLTGILSWKSLVDYGVTREELEHFAEVVMTQQGRLMANNYVTLTRLDVEKVYFSLYS